jgi:hypothetical protein
MGMIMMKKDMDTVIIKRRRRRRGYSMNTMNPSSPLLT